jgi:hypothetical protein
MAIEEQDLRDRDVWTAVSRHWYSKASDKAPTTGRLYHHLAILARPNALQQLFYYSKSLCVPTPFPSARESVMTLFEPILAQESRQSSRLPAVDAALTRIHAILFSGKAWDKLDTSMDEFLSLLDSHIGRSSKKWLESGYYIAIAGFCALQGYGDDNSAIHKALRPVKTEDAADVQMEEGVPEMTSPITDREFLAALLLTKKTHDIVLRRFGDSNILTYFHVCLVFMHHMSDYPALYVNLEPSFPWKLSALMLNTFIAPMVATQASFARIEGDEFPGGTGSATSTNVNKTTAKNAANRPLPEDFAMRGMPWADTYLPAEWFSNLKIDDDEKFFEVPSMTGERKERLLWLGRQIALRSGKTLTYDAATHTFGVSPEYDIEIEGLPKPGDLSADQEEDAMSVTEPDVQSPPASETPSIGERFEDDERDAENVPAAPSPKTITQ